MTSDHRETLAEPSRFSHMTGDAATGESLVARTRAIEPIIREHVETTERERRLARPVLQRCGRQDSFACSRRARWAVSKQIPSPWRALPRRSRLRQRGGVGAPGEQHRLVVGGAFSGERHRRVARRRRSADGRTV